MTEPHLAGPALLDSPEAPPPRRPAHGDDRRLRILGVEITDVTVGRAIELIDGMLQERDGAARAVYFANAHTLNCAAADPDYRRLLNEAARVFGDGTGVRWAARLQGVRVRDNLCGTDLLPALMRATTHRGYRYYLLGAAEPVVRGAARCVAELLGDPSGVAGCHHGYLADPGLGDRVIDAINDSGADVLLVGMGNPIQEGWIHEHRARLRVGVAMGVGGLFDYMSGQRPRAPRWLRRIGAEWLGVLLRDPRKARRYLLGNPLFLWRIARERLAAGRRSGA
jgi:N-acetylglucosaminyldiphosphoundecaprenol N-acetyl-beta-D-mannosaminyltransferase